MKTTVASEGKTCKPRHIPNSAKMTAIELQKAHDQIADQYDKRIWFDQHILGLARLRRKLLSKARGKILDVACGTGQNFSSFAPNSQITAVDLSPKMLELARENANGLNLN